MVSRMAAHLDAFGRDLTRQSPLGVIHKQKSIRHGKAMGSSSLKERRSRCSIMKARGTRLDDVLFSRYLPST